MKRNPCVRNGPKIAGAPGTIRTSDPQIRSQQVQRLPLGASFATPKHRTSFALETTTLNHNKRDRNRTKMQKNNEAGRFSAAHKGLVPGSIASKPAAKSIAGRQLDCGRDAVSSKYRTCLYLRNCACHKRRRKIWSAILCLRCSI